MSELFDCGHDKFGHNAYFNKDKRNDKKYGPYCRKCKGIQQAKKNGTYYDNRDTHFRCGHPRNESNSFRYRDKRVKSGWSVACRNCRNINRWNKAREAKEAKQALLVKLLTSMSQLTGVPIETLLHLESIKRYDPEFYPCGHARTEENSLRIHKGKHTICRACQKIRNADRYRDKKKEIDS